MAIVTGVTSGIGRATAARLAHLGVNVVGGARRSELGLALVDDLVGSDGTFDFVRTDVRDVADCLRLAEVTLERFGRIDILINCAGFEGAPPIVASESVTETQWDAVVDTNLKGLFFCCQGVLPTMRAQRAGTILNISSINAIEGPARMAAYSASKAAVIQLTRTLAVEYVLDGLRINVVVVGGVATAQAERTREAIASHVLGSAAGAPQKAGANPLVYSPDEASRVLVWLCQPDADITGATIAMDRAMSAGSMASTLIYMTSAGIWHKPYVGGSTT
ncbi:MAG: SDR family NAD(P)-dependent oxidoreductase [Acidimicrobiales bacterium]